MKAQAFLAAAVAAAALVTAAAVGARPAGAEQAQTVVTVTLYEHGIKLSRNSVPAGTVVFRVVNAGKAKHAFRAGSRTTPLLRPGQRTTLTVQLAKPGTVTLVCTTAGHAAKGMTRKLTVAAPKPQYTVVGVSMFEMGFKLSQSTVPAGTVEFRVANDGKLPHDFRIGSGGTPVFGPGRRATVTIAFPKPGTYTFICTVEGHAGAGMVGKLTVK